MFTQATVKVQDWSASSLNAYLEEHQGDPLEAIDALGLELDALAESDVLEASRRAGILHSACWSRVKDEARRLGLREPWLLGAGYVARQQQRRAWDLAFGLDRRFKVELYHRERALRRRGGSKLLIDRGGA